MSIKVSNLVWASDITPPSTRLVLLCLADLASDDGGRLWPSMATIARRCQISDRQAQRIMKPLRDLRERPDDESPTVAALKAQADKLEQEARTLEEAERAALETVRTLRGAASQASQAHKASLARVDAAEQARKGAEDEFSLAQYALKVDADWLAARRKGITHQDLAQRFYWLSRIQAQKQELEWCLQGWQAASVHDVPRCCMGGFADELDQVEPPLLTGEVPDGARALLCEELPPAPKFEALSAATASAPPSDGAVTLENVKALTTKAADLNRDAVVRALAKYGAKRAPDVKAENWSAYAADLREIIARAA